MKASILLSIITFTLLLSCTKKDNSPNPSSNTPFFSAKVNGKDFKISNYTFYTMYQMPGGYTAYEPTDISFGDTTNGIFNPIGIQIINNDTISIGFEIDQFKAITTGTYPFKNGTTDGCSLHLYLNGYEDALVDNVTGSLIISSINIDKNTLQGTFSGTFSAIVKITPVGKPQETITITDGVITNMKIN